MKTLYLDVVSTRGSAIESRHRVHAAVVDASGKLVAGARDPELVTHWRSCAKPFQVMPLLDSRGFDRLGWGDDELALACASHGGEPEHVALAQSMLSSIGLEEGDLACGAHEPLSQRGAKLWRESGIRLTRLHNNCSGKHAAMLARAHTANWPLYGYERVEHQVQRGILDVIVQWAQIEQSRIACAVDGCGVAEFAFPLVHMARAYAKLAESARRREELAARVVGAMGSRPFLVGGTDRFDTVLIEATGGRVIAKIGADGVHSVAVVDEGLGLTVKVEDGAQRAQYPAVIAALQALGVLRSELPPRLEEFRRKPLRNTRGEVVGEVRPAAEE
jgi:L-asparaginase II